jgi:hypothetical protein
MNVIHPKVEEMIQKVLPGERIPEHGVLVNIVLSKT